MNLAEQISKARALSRTTDNAKTDSEMMDAINNGIREFSKDVYGITTDDYLTIVPKFSTRTNFGFVIDDGTTSLTVTIASLNDATGTTIAASLENAIQASWGSATVSWDTAAWKYTVTIPSATYIHASDPPSNYVSMVETIFGGTTEVSASALTGGFPEDCTVEVSLPSGFLQVYNVEWDKCELYPTSFDKVVSPEQHGDPTYYNVTDGKMRFYPVPDSQKMLHVFYRGIPTVYPSTTSSMSCALDAEYHMAPVYYAAAEIAEENFEYEVSNRMMGRYSDQVRKYILQHANQDPNKEKDAPIQPFTNWRIVVADS